MGRKKDRKLVEALGEVCLQPFYSLHLVTLLSYFVLRSFALPSVSAPSQAVFFRWESQAGLCLVLILVVKFIKSNTLEGFIGDSFLYVKCVLLLLVAILDPRILPWYLFIFAAIFLLWHQPPYSGPDNVWDLSPLHLERQLLEDPSVAWLVEFGAAWSPQCTQFRRIFADLSLKYSSQTLQFGRVDVGRFPLATSKYNIEFGVLFRQLPTLILFEAGAESRRIPQSTSDAVSFSPILTKSFVVRHFELDLLLIQALSRKAGSARGETWGK